LYFNVNFKVLNEIYCALVGVIKDWILKYVSVLLGKLDFELVIPTPRSLRATDWGPRSLCFRHKMITLRNTTLARTPLDK
jgi:hypothetical protein